ncbi:L-threonylcarbamoyladenylate synthase [Acetobacterium woodii]|uniref:Threonylcarbamoyl-AMP synthase n=1 Tax=Acetobacterium woodii (strain ATCC 29683 / DSM 1030 / JCM 2381 / KCTC 1655 / WB1) TaxID=931626 RepID=H6LFS5_ACEWD|nr:L-threonylcarbamoyladenylate synthase [Acetobacterium woodii]AFA47020.1 Sua5/YciO/YrdC/YwlC family protein [Acetobacterium woodii DSM 1030]
MIEKMKTKIVCIETLDRTAEKNLNDLASLIKNGGTVVFPTETVYGLGADALNPQAIKKIFAAKGRPDDNPLIVHIADLNDVQRLVAEIPEKAKTLMKVFWPGPLTIIMEKAAVIPTEVTAGLNTVGVRFPDHPIAQAFIKTAGCPIAAPSANRSGRPSPTQGKHVLEDLDGRVDGIILSSDAELGLESTVIDMTIDPPVVLRPGDITLAELREVLGEVKVSTNVTENVIPEKVSSPGMKYTHYSPNGDLVVVKGTATEIREKIIKLLSNYKGKPMTIGVLASNETMADYQEGLIISLGSQSDPGEMAKNLFARLRTFDELGVEKIYAEDIPLNNETLALINRLYKAAGYTFI